MAEDIEDCCGEEPALSSTLADGSRVWCPHCGRSVTGDGIYGTIDHWNASFREGNPNHYRSSTGAAVEVDHE